MPTFEPPVVFDTPRVLPSTRGNQYWIGRVLSPIPRGRTVLKGHDGTYVTVDTPTVDQIAAAAIAYQGGHIYHVDTAEAAALTAAGFTVSNFDGGAGPFTWETIPGTWAEQTATWESV